MYFFTKICSKFGYCAVTKKKFSNQPIKRMYTKILYRIKTDCDVNRRMNEFSYFIQFPYTLDVDYVNYNLSRI